MPQFKIGRPPQTDDELWMLVATLWNVEIPRTPVCPGHSSPFHAFAEAFFARSPISVWKASRGFGGKTTLMGTLALTESAILGAEITILGGSAAQSLRVHEVVQESMASPFAPADMLAKEPTRYDTTFTNGGHVRALTASQRSVRGPHPQRLRLDEIDEMEIEIFDASMGQPMNSKSVMAQTVASSTHQYPDKTMTEILKRAKRNMWPVHEWCYRETIEPHGWLSQAELARKKTEVSEAMWLIEYDLQEPSFEGRAIDPYKVDEAFNPEIGYWDGRPGEYIELEAPDEDERYVTGVDWAKEQDWTVIRTFKVGKDGEPWKEVAFERIGRMPWPEMVERADRRISRYGGVGVHDATGLGNVVADLMRNDVRGVVMAGRARQDIFSEYVSGIENGEIVSPRINYAYEEHKYCQLEDLYGRGHPPDSIVAGALAWSMRSYFDRFMVAPFSLHRRESPWVSAGR